MFWPAGASPAPVTIYFDRSGSVAGFLDPRYQRESTDYRAVIGAIIASLSPATGYFFGSVITPVDVSEGVLGDRGQYQDRNTNVEQVMDSVAAQASPRRSHIMIGDGRRSDPNVANTQYVRMRREAERWIDLGGTFLVAASFAPFYPVGNDASGCRTAEEGRAETGRCPLYAFAFAARGDESRIAEALARVFQHLFVWPTPTLPPGIVSYVAIQSSDGLEYDGGWTTSAWGAQIARVRSTNPGNTMVTVRMTVSDSASGMGRVANALLRSQIREVSVATKMLDTAAVAQPWVPATSSAAPVRPANDGGRERQAVSLQVVSRGPGPNPALYRVDVLPRGEPVWREQYEARNSSDAVRTFGLGRLFEAFVARERRAVPMTRAFVVTQ